MMWFGAVIPSPVKNSGNISIYLNAKILAHNFEQYNIFLFQCSALIRGLPQIEQWSDSSNNSPGQLLRGVPEF